MPPNERVEATQTDTHGRLPGDAVSDLLASECRRRALWVLAEADGAMAVSDLARRVAALEHGTDTAAVDADTAERLRTEIYQDHLPKLTATEVVTYDSLVGTVELATDDERLVPADPTDA